MKCFFAKRCRNCGVGFYLKAISEEQFVELEMNPNVSTEYRRGDEITAIAEIESECPTCVLL